MIRCPGQDTRFWKPGDIFEVTCPQCSHNVEFFKDDPSRRCKNCGYMLLNPGIDFGCAAYCKFAQQCLGNLPPELTAQKKELLKHRVAIEMKHYFKKDFKRIGHAGKVARYAEQIALNERADMAVVVISAYLHDIGMKETEGSDKKSAAYDHEKIGDDIVRKILERVTADQGLIEEVCDIISHLHHPRPDETLNFKSLHDADMLVNLEQTNKDEPFDKDVLRKIIKTSFFTKTGQKLARNILYKA